MLYTLTCLRHFDQAKYNVQSCRSWKPWIYITTVTVVCMVCWSLTSLCHSNGHIETMPAREINPFTALTRIRSQFLRTQWSTSNHQWVDMTTPHTAQPSSFSFNLFYTVCQRKPLIFEPKMVDLELVWSQLRFVNKLKENEDVGLKLLWRHL